MDKSDINDFKGLIYQVLDREAGVTNLSAAYAKLISLGGEMSVHWLFITTGSLGTLNGTSLVPKARQAKLW